MTDIKKVFGIISDKVQTALAQQSFKREKVAGSDKEMVALFTGESIAYSVVYDTEKMLVELRSCSMTEDGPDNDWKSLAKWLFNPETDTPKEAESIANDFFDIVSSAASVKRAKQSKKKKGEDGNADPLFLSKRFVTYFPELKDMIREEQDKYESFRSVHFIRTNVVPRVNQLLERGAKNEMNKLAQMISTQYTNGDMDTRSIITMVILNSVDEKHIEKFEPLLSEELQKSWTYAKKMKGKKVKPEKPKKVMAAYSSDKLGR